MTDTQGGLPDALSIVREIIRRSGHEIRNSLNGVAVNVEVVRSRSARQGGPGKGEGEVGSFGERAAREIAEASALTNGTLALVDAMFTAAVKGSLRTTPGNGAASEIEVMIYGDKASIFMSDVQRLAEAINVRVEQRGQSVILKVLPEDRSHSES